MKVRITPYVIESAIDNCWKVYLGRNRWNAKQNQLHVLDKEEFFGDWADFLSYIDGSSKNMPDSKSLSTSLKFVSLESRRDYDSFEQYLADHSSAKNVVVLKMSKSLKPSAYDCEEILNYILNDALGVDTGLEDCFLLESKKSVYAGMFIEY